MRRLTSLDVAERLELDPDKVRASEEQLLAIYAVMAKMFAGDRGAACAWLRLPNDAFSGLKPASLLTTRSASAVLLNYFRMAEKLI